MVVGTLLEARDRDRTDRTNVRGGGAQAAAGEAREWRQTRGGTGETSRDHELQLPRLLFVTWLLSLAAGLVAEWTCSGLISAICGRVRGELSGMDGGVSATTGFRLWPKSVLRNGDQVV